MSNTHIVPYLVLFVFSISARAQEAIYRPQITAIDLHAVHVEAESPAHDGALTFDEEQPPIAFVDVNVISMDTYSADSSPVLSRYTVVASAGAITRIGPVGEVDVPAGTRVIDGRGELYLMPGMTDAHVHLYPDSDPEAWVAIFLTQGITTVMNLGGSPHSLELRKHIIDGGLLGPRVFTTAPYVNDTRPRLHAVVKTKADAWQVAREQKAAGYDMIKIHGDVDEEPYRELVAAGASLGIPVIGHAPRNLPFQAVLDAGQPMLVHLEEMLYVGAPNLERGRIAILANTSAKAGLWVIPNMGCFGMIADQWGKPEAVDRALERPGARYLTRGILREWTTNNPYTRRTPVDGIRANYEFLMDLLTALHRAGVRMMIGTDTPVPTAFPGFSFHVELESMAMANIPTFDILEAATRNPGDFARDVIGSDVKFGRIRAGFEASLVLLDENPLEDIGTLESPRGVLVRGRWLSREKLESILDGIERAAAR